MSAKTKGIKFKAGYKYQLVEEYRIRVNIPIKQSYDNGLLACDLLGNIIIRAGYAWDGATCAIDTNNFMRGSLIHDALYQLIREESIDGKYRTKCDDALDQILKEDGMSSMRRWYVQVGVKNFGGKAADPKNKRKVIQAP